MISLNQSDFTNFQVLSDEAETSGANVVLSGNGGDTLTIDNMTKSELAEFSADFKFS